MRVSVLTMSKQTKATWRLQAVVSESEVTFEQISCLWSRVNFIAPSLTHSFNYAPLILIHSFIHILAFIHLPTHSLTLFLQHSFAWISSLLSCGWLFSFPLHIQPKLRWDKRAERCWTGLSWVELLCMYFPYFQFSHLLRVKNCACTFICVLRICNRLIYLLESKMLTQGTTLCLSPCQSVCLSVCLCVCVLCILRWKV